MMAQALYDLAWLPMWPVFLALALLGLVGEMLAW